MRRNILLQHVLLLLLIYSPMVVILSSNTILDLSAITPNSNTLSRTEKIVDEIVVEDIYMGLSMGVHYRNSIIQINITVQPISNGSVELVAFGDYVSEFSPTLTNFTLAPGESYTEHYKYLVGTLNELVYSARSILPDTNATIRWWYEVLKSVGPSEFIGIEFPFILGGLALSTSVLNFISKRKSSNKNN